MPEEKLYELNRFDTDTFACLVKPQTLGAGVYGTIWLGLGAYDKVMFIIQGGVANDAAATLDALVNQATDNAGAGSKPIAGKAITQVVAGAGFATLNQLFYIHVDIEELDVDNGFAFAQLYLTVSTGDTWNIAVLCQRQHRVFEPVAVTYVTQLID